MKLNIAHSEFPQQIGGLMICGYEWGYSKRDEEFDAAGEPIANPDAIYTFTTKDTYYGPHALTWRYDNNIIKWFGLWGHPLSRSAPSDFEKSIVQTNWCDTQSNNMEGDYERLADPANVANFMAHVEKFRPALILLMGSRLVDVLNRAEVRCAFERIAGSCIKGPTPVQKDGTTTRFKVWFQSFERCRVVGLPHPSSSRGLSDDYIHQFAGEMAPILEAYKQAHLG